MIRVNVFSLFVSIFICLLAGGIGSLFTVSSISGWYTTLDKPFFNPPNWVFGPVWTVLYILMGISLYIVWHTNTKKPEKRMGLMHFFIQLALNTIWSVVFFGLRSPGMAFIVIIALWITILLTVKYFYSVSKNASLLLLPYLLWVSFASILNFSIVILNR